MELTLEYKNAASAALDKFATQFPDFVLIEDEPELAIDELIISRSIRELKHMTDFLAKTFTVSLPAPKRNSKVSLSRWVVKVLCEVVQIESSIEDVPVQTIQPEVVEPEVYNICLLGDDSYSRHLVKRLPLYLLFGKSLYQKSFSLNPDGIVSYFQVLSQFLPDIQTEGDSVCKIELLCDDCWLTTRNVCCTPPSHLVSGKKAFRRERRELITQSSVVRYSQLLCEPLEDFCLVSYPISENHDLAANVSGQVQ